MSQFHKPRETDYYLRVPTELVVFQEPALFFFLDGIKSFFKRERERREGCTGERERVREQEKRGEREGERENQGASLRAQTPAHRAGATARWQCYPAVGPRAQLGLGRELGG